MYREQDVVAGELTRIVDLILIGIGYYFTSQIYQAKGAFRMWPHYFILFFIYIISWVICSLIFNLYVSRRFSNLKRELYSLLVVNFLSFALGITFINLYDPKLFNNRFIFYFEAIVGGLTFLLHIIVRLLLEAYRKTGKNTRNVLILGAGPGTEDYVQKVGENPQHGFKVIGYLAPQKNERLRIPYLGVYGQLESVIKLNVVDLTVATSFLSDAEIQEAVEQLELMGKSVAILLDEITSKVARSRPIDFEGLSIVAYDSVPKSPWQVAFKRLMDFVLSLVGLVIFSPVFLIVAIAIKVSSQGPVLFAQDRVGLNGRIFKMYKFRSMIVSAEELKEKLVHLNEMSGPVFKIKNDPRVTTVGRFLRKTSLDELPQLWNVLLGQMSLVGPRPPLPKEVNLYNPQHRKRLAVKPGITCIWQISGRNEVDFDQWMEMDAEYVDRWSLWLDMEILAKTVPVVLMRKGAS